MSALREFVEKTVDLVKRCNPHRLEWYGPYDAVLRHGREMKLAEATGDMDQQCYRNAFLAALGDDERFYCEGIAWPDGLIPVEHAWTCDRDGNVYDPTWDKQAVTYLGIPFRFEFVAKVVMRDGTYGVLDKLDTSEPFPVDQLAL